tara:strand:+ start:266 stop:511 length:246 start_codon:yes stop_codon:yes gene_type:complete
MSSEVHKYIEKALEKNENLFNAEVLDFPNDKKISEIKNLNTENQNIWKINDKSNDDQLKAIVGLCFMFGVLIVIGLYSTLS